MTALYTVCNITKQGHWDAVKRQTEDLLNECLYIGLIEEVRVMHPGMGLRKMYNQFKPEGINRDEFIALGLREGYRLRTIKAPQKTTQSIKSARYKNLLIGKRFTNVNQLSVSDLFYFSIKGQHYYVVLIMDVYSRKIVGYSVADNMRAENNVAALSKALILRGVENYDGKLIHHSDRGSQYVSSIYTDMLTQYGIEISMCKDVLENAHCERANGTIKNEYLARWEIRNFNHLRRLVEMAVNNYNNRLHNSLKMTPNEFEIYVKEQNEDERLVLEVFTINKSLENPTQLEIQFDY